MKASLVLAALALSITSAVSVQAQTAGAPVRGDFASHKSAILAHLDQRLASLTALRGCVANAAIPADLKTCHEQNHRAMNPSHTPN